MKEDMAVKGVERQILLLPEVVELDSAETDRLMARRAELAEIGFVLESFGDRRFWFGKFRRFLEMRM